MVAVLRPDLAELVRQAKMVLDFNWTGEYTKPGPRLYPHQWSWDSGLVAIGYSCYDTGRAVRELTHLFDARWKNGLLPQIVFDPRFGRYFPGIDFWHADESPDAPSHAKTSGIVQPPVHATAVMRVYRRSGEGAQARAFLEYAYPILRSWHDYLYRERDPEGEGLVYIRHPWESGMDNSPMWDSIMMRLQLRPEEIPTYQRADTHAVSAEDRPVSAEYDRFAYLVRFFADRGYDEARIRQDCPFLVQDVLFNSLLCEAERDLAEISRVLGEDPSPFERRAEKTARAIDRRLWDEEHATYLDHDLVSGCPIHAYASSNLAGPLYAGIPGEERARRMVALLETPCFGLGGAHGTPVASYDRYGYGFSPVRYWRGPVWINVNWFLMRGLERYGYGEHAAGLRGAIVSLCRDEGFYEYFDPTTGMGHGSDLFSWTAALALDCLLENPGA
ncbi:MAG: trehalase family glycosidase [Actinomycetota bacterium]